jgi:hypothetical protein
MLWKKKEEKVLEPVDMKTGIELLQEQIEAAKQLLDKRPVKSRDQKTWNDRTHSCLIRIYGQGSPNIDTIVEASGEAPVWLFMPADVAEKHEASCLENKMQKLKECVVALKRKAREAQIS